MKKYVPCPPMTLPDRQWPSRRLEKAPIWCSVDLRDGNQALVEPMNVEEKLEMFKMLVRMGFKEIEVGFPSASQTEFDCVRTLIEQNLIPDDVTIQVLTQAREHLIRRTFEAVEGAKHVIMHLYTNISPMFQKCVYKTTRKGIVDIAVREIELMRMLAEMREDGGEGVTFEYSPECFSEAEPRLAMVVLTSVIEHFGATPEKKLILNLPSTVEKTTPNEFADRIEYVDRFLPGRESVILSVHPHNDRGTGIAAAEMALLAGAERVEGTLFGNGERTGNVDLVTLGLNMAALGVQPGLDFKHLMRIRQVYERCTRMHVPERSPYAGDLVFTAFSGSHQDAIRKGFAYRAEHPRQPWQVPYLLIDPKDIGRSYEPIIRINSQSGKGGAAYVLQTRFGYNLPKAMHPELGALVKKEAVAYGSELPPERLLHLFLREFVSVSKPYSLLRHTITEIGGEGHSQVKFTGTIRYHDEEHELCGEGNGPIDAFFSAMRAAHIEGFRFVSYHEHAISSGSDAKACAYIELEYRGHDVFGVGIHSNVSIASIRGVLTAINRALTLYGEA